jgi:hypothetical protein
MITLTLAEAIRWQRQQEEINAHALLLIKDTYLGTIEDIRVNFDNESNKVVVDFTQYRAGVPCTETHYFDFEEFFEV